VKSIYRVGVDENGLGARLGPLLVTAVLARIEGPSRDAFSRALPARVARDLRDSKELLSHADVRLGEAWARALVGPELTRPNELFARVSLANGAELMANCPPEVAPQCWVEDDERFRAPDELVRRVQGHLATLAGRGIHIVAVRSSALCTRLLNLGRRRGESRFTMDLHQMERLVLELREVAGSELSAVCGKVGGMSDYSRFWGPLGGRLHAVLAQGRRVSAYRFPGLGELSFVQDADAEDPLVMLASLVGKYLRELLMARIARHWERALGESFCPSGYHDPVTERFVAATEELRRERRMPDECFERERGRL
jgi:ribonuclease HII